MFVVVCICSICAAKAFLGAKQNHRTIITHDTFCHSRTKRKDIIGKILTANDSPTSTLKTELKAQNKKPEASTSVPKAFSCAALASPNSKSLSTLFQIQSKGKHRSPKLVAYRCQLAFAHGHISRNIMMWSEVGKLPGHIVVHQG